jgi:acetyl esterase/lipase
MKAGFILRCAVPLTVIVAASGISMVRGAEASTNFPDAETFVYRKLEPEPLRLFVIKPQGWGTNDRRPALIFFFGGGWTRGDASKSISWARLAAKWGMVGVAPDYRTAERFKTSPAESVADARLATRWVEDHAAQLGVDTNKIVVGGNSAGAHVALWAGITKTPFGSKAEESPSTKPAALVLLSTPADTTPEAWNNDLRLIARFGPHMADLSPQQNLDAKMPPVILFHGEVDKTVPHSIAAALHDKLVATGNVCEFISIPGGGHNYSGDVPEWKEKTREKIKAFLIQQHVLPVVADKAQ